MRRSRNSCGKCTELERRISILESKIDARPSRTDDVRGTSKEGFSATDAAGRSAENAPRLAGATVDGSVDCIDFTGQNVSTERWLTQGAKPKRKRVVTSTPVRSAATTPIHSGHQSRCTARTENYNISGPLQTQQPIPLQNRFECLRHLEPVVSRETTQDRG